MSQARYVKIQLVACSARARLSASQRLEQQSRLVISSPSTSSRSERDG